MTALRELSITYGAITVGGTSDVYQLDGFTRHTVTDGVSDSFIEFDVVVIAASAAALAGRCAAIERVFRTPRKSLTVVQSGIPLIAVSHAAASGGFNTLPEIRKIGQEGDSARSRRYSLRVKFETPADTVSTSGLRESSVNVEYDAARIRTVTLSGVFTAVPGTTSARARYDAAIAAHASSVLSSLSVTTSELVGEPTSEHDYDDKTIRFARVYRELIFGQGTDAASDDPGIVDQNLKVSRREFSEERSAASQIAAIGSSSVQALAVFDVRYEASIDSTVTTSLHTKYQSIRSWLLGQIRTMFSQGQFALMSEKPEYHRDANRITVDIVAEGPVGGQSMTKRIVSVTDRIVEPTVFRNAWDGDVLAAYIYEGHATVTRTITETYRRIGSETSAGANAYALSLPGAYSYPPTRYLQGTWYVVESSGDATPIRIGIEGQDTIDMVDVSAVVTMRRVMRVAGESQTKEVPKRSTTPAARTG